MKKKIFKFLNELILETDDLEFLNMIIIQVFEKLYDKRTYFDLGKKHLCRKGVDLLLSISDNFNLN